MAVLAKAGCGWYRESYMDHDKKVRQHRIQWVLLNDIGEPTTGIEIPFDRVQAAYNTLEGQ